MYEEQASQQPPLDFDACLYFTVRYMRAQRWQLVDARTLTERFWPDLREKGLRGRDAQKVVETAVWQNYGAVLYDGCRQADPERREKAWAELEHWLKQRARGKISDAQEREDVLQEALIRLHAAFERDKLQAPRAIWAVAIQALLSAGADRHRKRTAQKRGVDRAESLDALEEQRGGPSIEQLPLTAPPGGPPLRPLEDVVIDREHRRQLELFFEEHLNSDLQRAVARAFFLEDYSPAEIAALLGKSPHEVRMLKSRVVRTLRALPQTDIDRLLAILGTDLDDEEDSNNDPAPT